MSPGLRSACFRQLRELLASCYGGQAPAGFLPWLQPTLSETIACHQLPEGELALVIDGCEQDLAVTRYPSFEALCDYCYKVAAIIGALTIRVHGGDPGLRSGYVWYGGISVQLINILRDVVEDLERGRIYLPEEDLARFDIDPDELAGAIGSDRFRALMRFEAERVRQWMAIADRLLPASEHRRYLPLTIIRRIYGRLLDRIEADGFDVSRRQRLPSRQKLGIAVGTLLGVG